MKDVVNMLFKKVYYNTGRYGIAHQIRPFIYNANFKAEEDTQSMAWIYFPDLLPTFFVREYLFILASAVGKPIHLDTITINKTQPSCAKVYVQVNLAAKLPDSMELEVKNVKPNETRIQKVKIQYDMFPNYYHTYKLQGHLED
ncbi:hypothetical protein FXO38_15069, partial [Capsicum annuum]